MASDEDAGAGFDLGDTVVIEPGGAELTVVGLAADAQLNVGPTLFVTYDTYVEAVAARNPDAGEPLPNALGVVPDARHESGASSSRRSTLRATTSMP